MQKVTFTFIKNFYQNLYSEKYFPSETTQEMFCYEHQSQNDCFKFNKWWKRLYRYRPKTKRRHNRYQWNEVLFERLQLKEI